jgi:SAM-dependent methyltransferase
MERGEYVQMYQLESSHWYFRGKRAVLLQLLRLHLTPGSAHRLLDVGCGTGGMLEVLKEFGLAYGVDRSALALGLCRERRIDGLILADASTSLPLKDAQFDVVCALDVLEHLPDERPLLGEIRRVLRPKGFLLVTVPAFKFLWSEHDDALRHYRRYTRRGLQDILEKTGFRIVRLSYYNSLLFPIAFFYRVLRRTLTRKAHRIDSTVRGTPQSDFFVQLPSWVNEVLAACFTLEARLLSRGDLPLGLGVVGIVQLND